MCKNKKSIRIKYIIELFFFQCFVFLVKILPKVILPSFGRGIGNVLFYLKIRKKVILKNLEIAFSLDKTKEERLVLCKQVYQNLGQTLVEVLLMSSLKSKKLENYISLEGLEILQEAYAKQKGVVIVTGHFGNWEMQSAAISMFGIPMHGYAGKQKNIWFDQKLNEIRKKFNMIPISKSVKSTREMMKVLKEKKLLGIIGDLNVPHEDLFVNFFGKKASLGKGFASYVVKYKVPLLFACIVRIGPLQHRSKIVEIPYQLTGNTKTDIQHISQLYINYLEQVIRQHPEHYFWVNKRWKTRPADDPENPY